MNDYCIIYTYKIWVIKKMPNKETRDVQTVGWTKIELK